MKKYVKIIIIILIVLVVLVILNTIRNISIINGLRNSAEEYCSDMTSYKITTTDSYNATDDNTGETLIGTLTETIYHKDGKTIGKELLQIEGREDEKNINTLSEEIDYLEPMKIDYWLNEEMTTNNNIITYCFSFIKTSGDTYVIEFCNGDSTVCFNKETGMLEGMLENYGYTCKVEKNTVTDEDFENL